MCRSIQFALSVKKDEPWHRTSGSWLARYICATRRDKEANRGATQPAGFPSKGNPGNLAVCLTHMARSIYILATILCLISILAICIAPLADLPATSLRSGYLRFSSCAG
jgi:hypothetical protein